MNPHEQTWQVVATELGVDAEQGLPLGAFWFYFDVSLQNGAESRSVAFTVLALSPMFYAFTARSRSASVFSLALFSNWRLLGAFGAALVLQAIAVFAPYMGAVFDTIPLGAGDVAVCMLLAMSVWGLGEIVKLTARQLRSAS